MNHETDGRKWTDGRRWLESLLSLWLTLSLLVPISSAQTPTGEEILNQIDANMVLDEAVRVAQVVIHGRRGSRTITSRAWIKGEDKVLVEYLSPPREKGKKTLKLGDKLWTYTPEPSDRIIAISGHLLRQSVMGSDLSYEDMTENSKLRDLYDATVEGKEMLDDRLCWVVTLTANQPDVTYHSRKLWVDVERWLPLREERYAKSGRLLKRFSVQEVYQVEGRWYPKRMHFKDMLMKGNGTDYIVESLELGVSIPDSKFTKAALRR